MAKVTSRLQVTIPRELAERNGIEPGDEVEVVESEGALRIVPAKTTPLALEQRVNSFRASMERQRERQKLMPPPTDPPPPRGWTREELYDRDRDR
jgi:AbrB family looped-hinge helix DNA binding protein